MKISNFVDFVVFVPDKSMFDAFPSPQFLGLDSIELLEGIFPKIDDNHFGLFCLVPNK